MNPLQPIIDEVNVKTARTQVAIQAFAKSVNTLVRSIEKNVDSWNRLSVAVGRFSKKRGVK